MLSSTWNTYREDLHRRQNLFSGMSRLILSLARVPQSKIGSFRFNNDGTVTLANRPLSCCTIILENNGATRVTQRNETYACTEAWTSDMLTLHDNRFLNQRNAVFNTTDCHSQMAVKTLLRTFSHHFIWREYRNGPFLLQFTDFHASNLLVDEEWNITGLIDLEWICSYPVEMLDVPYWLTGQGIDELVGEQLVEYSQVREEFTRIFEKEERALAYKIHGLSLAVMIRDMWASKGIWFWHSLSSINAMYQLFEKHLGPSFGGDISDRDAETIARFWCGRSPDVVSRKLEETIEYEQDLQRVFAGEETV